MYVCVCDCRRKSNDNSMQRVFCANWIVSFFPLPPLNLYQHFCILQHSQVFPAALQRQCVALFHSSRKKKIPQNIFRNSYFEACSALSLDRFIIDFYSGYVKIRESKACSTTFCVYQTLIEIQKSSKALISNNKSIRMIQWKFSPLFWYRSTRFDLRKKTPLQI